MPRPTTPTLIPFTGTLPDIDSPTSWATRTPLFWGWATGPGYDNSTEVIAYSEGAMDYVDAALAGSETLVDSVADLQARLNFTPVEQGGGDFMSDNKIYIGWDGPLSRVRLQVDEVQKGTIVTSQTINADIGSDPAGARLAIDAQPRLGFTPVRQSGLGNTVDLGWNGLGVSVGVDNTFQGIMLTTTNNQQVGVNQGRQTPGRSSGTTYQNTTGRPISVNITLRGGGSVQVSDNGASWITVGNGAENAQDFNNTHMIVRANEFYRANGIIEHWVELRT